MKINGDVHYLWWAVDHEGEVLEPFGSRTRDKAAALKFIKNAMKRRGKAKIRARLQWSAGLRKRDWRLCE